MPVERTPARNGDLPTLATGEELRLSEAKTRLYAGSNLQGEGILHLTNRRIVWLGSPNTAIGYAFDYPFVTLHAVSRDKSAWPEPCLYCQLRSEDEENQGDDEEEPEIPEMRFVPADAGHLQNIFTVFSEMSALNPDPQDTQAGDSSSEDDDEDAEAPFAVQELGVMWNADNNDAAMEDADEDDEDEEEEDAEGDAAMECK
mmetsp:Transcript_120590/g.257531  ORF Transcript_120590/g.257531 Transcript_120590/m.257531 type:complete len:201 (+) Transcript_120590:68-670(+)